MDATVRGIMRDTTTVNDTTWDVISLPGGVTAFLDVGKPQVPRLPHLLGIPDNATVSVSVQVKDSCLVNSILCYPYQGAQLEDSTYPLMLDTVFYALDTVYPAIVSQLMNTGIWRDFSVANIQTYPVRHNPAESLLTVYHRYRITSSYTGTATATR